MKVIETKLPGVLMIEPRVFADERGFFLETFRQTSYRQLGLPAFVQSNHSRSKKGVLRGLHYQLIQPQGKLVRVSRGCVYDVAVDVRQGSSTFGQWVGCLLDDVTHRQFYVPPGFAHGFLVLSEEADFQYQCTDYYHADSEQSIRWNDPDINIDWQLEAKKQGVDVKAFTLSKKDEEATLLRNQASENLPKYQGRSET